MSTGVRSREFRREEGKREKEDVSSSESKKEGGKQEKKDCTLQDHQNGVNEEQGRGKTRTRKRERATEGHNQRSRKEERRGTDTGESVGGEKERVFELVW